MNMGTYIKCHNGTSTLPLSSSLSPLGGGHSAPPWRHCSFASDTLVLRLMAAAAEADESGGDGDEGDEGAATGAVQKIALQKKEKKKPRMLEINAFYNLFLCVVEAQISE